MENGERVWKAYETLFVDGEDFEEIGKEVVEEIVAAYSEERVNETVKEMLKLIPEGADYSGRCYIGHSNSIEDCNDTVAKIEETFPNLKGNVKVYDIGNIIASHCGPGTVAVFFVGEER